MEIQPMVIEMPQHLEARLTPASARLNLAIGLYASDEVTLGQGAAIAQISIPHFMQELGKRNIESHYDMADLQEDLKAAREILQK